MQFGCALLVRGQHATRKNLRTMATQEEARGGDSFWASGSRMASLCLDPGGLTDVMPQCPAIIREVGRAPAEIELSLKVRLRLAERLDPQRPLHGGPEQILATIEPYQEPGIPHLVLECVPETVGNACAVMERFVRAGRPVVAPRSRHG